MKRNVFYLLFAFVLVFGISCEKKDEVKPVKTENNKSPDPLGCYDSLTYSKGNPDSEIENKKFDSVIVDPIPLPYPYPYPVNLNMCYELKPVYEIQNAMFPTDSSVFYDTVYFACAKKCYKVIYEFNHGSISARDTVYFPCGKDCSTFSTVKSIAPGGCYVMDTIYYPCEFRPLYRTTY